MSPERPENRRINIYTGSTSIIMRHVTTRLDLKMTTSVLTIDLLDLEVLRY